MRPESTFSTPDVPERLTGDVSARVVARVASMGDTARRLGRFWTAANVLSLIRITFVLPITALVWQGRTAADPLLLWLVGVGILTDFFDGKVARWTGSVSEWGKVLDPVADKAAALFIGGALAFRPDHGYNLPPWLFVLALVRDACILFGAIYLARRGHTVTPSVLIGKLAIAFFALSVLACVLEADAPILHACVRITGALLALSFFLYTSRFVWLARRLHRARVAADRADPPLSDGIL